MPNSKSLININDRISELEKEKLKLQAKKDPLSAKKIKAKLEKINKELENLKKEKEKMELQANKDPFKVKKLKDKAKNINKELEEKTSEEKINERKEINKDNLIEIDGKFYQKNSIWGFDWRNAIIKLDGKDYYISYEYNLQTRWYDEYYILLDSNHIKFNINWDTISCEPKDEHDFYKAKINWKLYSKNELVNIGSSLYREYRPKTDSNTKKAVRKNKAKGTIQKIIIFLFYCSFPTIIIWTLLWLILGIDEIALLWWWLWLWAGALAIIIWAVTNKLFED